MNLLSSLMRLASTVKCILKLLVELSTILKGILNLLIGLLTIFILVLKLLHLPVSTIGSYQDVRFDGIYKLVPKINLLNISTN